MTAVIKGIIGLIVALVGLWLLIPIPGYQGLYAGVSLQAFITLVLGGIPILLIFFGLIVAWIEFEEASIQRKEKKK